ncbi:MAG: hypothetical protein JXP36_15700 [Bacteroidales bacterium]|nr:hypothetical protein [Bacteroidales bacterium]
MEPKMPRKERQIIATTITLLAVVFIYGYIIYKKYILENPELVYNLEFWGRKFFLMIPIMIGSLIILMIIFAIVNKILTNQDMETMTDEMDKLIELKALKISRWSTNICFLLAIGSQAIGKEPWVMMAVLVISCFAGAIVEAIAKIYYYKKGV